MLVCEQRQAPEVPPANEAIMAAPSSVIADHFDHSCDARVAEIFAERFPGVRYLRFLAARDPSRFGSVWHAVGFAGPAERLLGLGLIPVGIPAGGRTRRVCYFGDTVWQGESTDRPPPGNRADVMLMRRPRGVIQVRVNIGDHDGLPAGHPLQVFHPRNWPFCAHESERRRAAAQALAFEVRSLANWMMASFERWGGSIVDGYEVTAADGARLSQACASFAKSLDAIAAEIEAGRVRRRSSLTLVAGNGKNSAPIDGDGGSPGCGSARGRGALRSVES